MSVEEILMRPGSGRVDLTADTPLSLTKAIYDLVVGVGCHIVITPTPIDPTLVSSADMLAAALYTGRVIARPDRNAIEFTGLSTWLDSYNETVITRTAGTPTNWVDDVILNNITRGTVSGGSNVTRSFPAHAQTRRQILDAVASEGGWEYEFRPNFTVNAGTSVFVTTPTVVITNKDEGPDGTYTGLLGGFADQEIDASNVVTKVVALGQGAGSSIVTGSATKTPALKTQNGSTPTLVTVVNAPNVPSASVVAVATAVNTASDVVVATTVVTAPVIDGPATPGGPVTRGSRQGVTIEDPVIFNRPGGEDAPGGGTVITYPNAPEVVDPGGFANAPFQAAADAFAAATLDTLGIRDSSGSGVGESQYVRRAVRPGDNVYVYDLESGLYNTSQQITYRGEVIFPLTKRVLSMTWAIEAGYGVYICSNAATRVWHDLTPYVAWETPGATLTVGDRPAASYTGIVNRSNPAIEQRVNGNQMVDITSATITQSGTVSGTINRGWYILRDDGTFLLHLTWTASAAGTAGNGVVYTLPFTLVNAEDVGGTIDVDASTQRAGVVTPLSTSTVRFKCEAATSVLGVSPAYTIANTNVLRLNIEGRWS